MRHLQQGAEPWHASPCLLPLPPAGRALNYSPRLVLAPPLLGMLLDAALAGLLVQHREACCSVLAFIVRLLDPATHRKCPPEGLAHLQQVGGGGGGGGGGAEGAGQLVERLHGPALCQQLPPLERSRALRQQPLKREELCRAPARRQRHAAQV